jgi:hypothetical protein
MTRTQKGSWSMKHRTALIVAASIAAVVLAAALAVAVNLGILTAADSSPVGQLTTTTVAQAAGTKPAAAYQSESPSPAASAKPQRQTQEYLIKQAGSVRIAFSDKAVRFVDAGARNHWTWKLSQTDERKLTVTFEHGAATYTFVAQVDDHGKVTAKVDHPVTQVVPSSGGATTWTAAPAPAANATSASGEPGEGTHDGGQADD